MSRIQIFGVALWAVGLAILVWAEWPLNRLQWTMLGLMAACAAVTIAFAGGGA